MPSPPFGIRIPALGNMGNFAFECGVGAWTRCLCSLPYCTIGCKAPKNFLVSFAQTPFITGRTLGIAHCLLDQMPGWR